MIYRAQEKKDQKLKMLTSEGTFKVISFNASRLLNRKPIEYDLWEAPVIAFRKLIQPSLSIVSG